MDTKTKSVIWILGTLLILVGILAAAGVLGNPLTIGKERGAVVLRDITEEERVFVDNILQKTQKTTDGRLVYVTPGNRDILIAKEGYWPWLKQTTVDDGQAVQLAPFFFRESPLTQEIQGDDPEYDALYTLTRKALLPVAPRALVSKDNTVTVWKEGSALKARWIGEGDMPPFFCYVTCSDTIEFSRMTLPLSEIHFLNERNDAVLVVIGQNVYALELDRRPVQNFQKIYSGESEPSVGITDTGEIYLSEGGKLFLLRK